MTRAVDPGTVEQGFRVAAGELGMCDASWRFADVIAQHGGGAALETIRDELGRSFPVLDAVLERKARGEAPRVVTSAVVEACDGLRRLVVIGVEARWLDALRAALPNVELAVLPAKALPHDGDRLAANLGHAQLTTLDAFQRFAGPKSGLLTFVYGLSPQSAFVLPEWVRCQGPDVRSQFRSFIGWCVLETPPGLYPRWLVEVSRSAFTEVVS